MARPRRGAAAACCEGAANDLGAAAEGGNSPDAAADSGSSRSTRSSTRGVMTRSARAKEAQQGENTSALATSHSADNNTGCSKSKRSMTKLDSKERGAAAGTATKTATTITTSDGSNTTTTTTTTSAGTESNKSSGTSSKGPFQPSMSVMPRVSLGLLRAAVRPSPKTSFLDVSARAASSSEETSTGNSGGGDIAIPTAFSRLSLGSHTPQPLLRPLRKLASGDRGAADFLDTTTAPGIVRLCPLEPTNAALLPAAMPSGKCGKSAERNRSEVAARVAAGCSPPLMTVAALQQGPLAEGGPDALSPDLETLRKEEKAQRKAKEKQQLQQWFGMPLKDLSPQLVRELRVLQLRGHASAKVFGGKSRASFLPLQKHKSKEGGPPLHSAYLQVARVVGGGLRGVGGGAESQAAGTFNKGAGRRGHASSLLHELLKDPEVNSWTKRKYREIQEKNNSRHSAGWTGKRKKKQKK
ncbi:uncharacterized protein LOC34617980 [Cyclospora cayetanensis]|uniref:Uncharacterized protein LOC34617980 n=1 Tax=Cyclospora cayetanensis TaxID=88456 RepID=A0A6P6RR97_9EIME|nr:uncharacterized protein LOC34617980 [Cyclospora cayetanensis]